MEAQKCKYYMSSRKNFISLKELALRCRQVINRIDFHGLGKIAELLTRKSIVVVIVVLFLSIDAKTKYIVFGCHLLTSLKATSNPLKNCN